MKLLYVGHYDPGSTTRMRGEYLRELLRPEEFVVGNIDIPINNNAKWIRSIGWRYKKGPLIKSINRYLEEVAESNQHFDLVWIDKGVFIEPAFLKKLKRRNNLLVHFTPDTAFLGNQSGLFYRGLPLYDFCITTKSFEKEYYKKDGARNLLYCTQGYDPKVHHSYNDFSAKTGVSFVGLWEPSREIILQQLLDRNIPVKLAGAKWGKFVGRNKSNACLNYLGPGLFGEDYGKMISGSLIGLGLLSKRFPELHTTRTFEIPACGTALVTERNEETRNFFSEHEAIFFSNAEELADKVETALKDTSGLETISMAGNKKVKSSGHDYRSILSKLLDQMRLQA